jgi:O-antigen/teichoic acid export membrane protein
MSRTKNTIKNLMANFLNVLVTVLLSFIVRTVFIKTLGKDYLGLNGLFTNILSILSLTELGIGTAISFRLYKPLANKDKKRITVLMKFYKQTYQIISLIILILGLLIMPFLDFFIKGSVDFINIYLVFSIYLLQTISSYMFFAYKTTLINADQKEHITVKVGMSVDIVSSIIQIFSLLIYKNFIIYISLLILFNIVKNFLISLKVDKEYPFIKESIDEKLSLLELKDMFKDFGAIFLYKINTVVLSATDNIIISAFLGITTVGLYSNYILIFNTLKKIISTFYNAVRASIGNLHATTNVKREYMIFNVINLITVILFGGAAIGIFVVSNAFITIWIGEQYVISKLFSFLLGIEFYLRGIQIFLSQFRTSMGLFQQAKYRPLFSILINLAISLLLVQFIDIYGVLIGTIIAILTTSMWYDPIIIHKYGFGLSSRKYFLKNIYYVFVVIVAGGVSSFFVNMIIVENILLLVVAIFICILVSLVTFLLFFIKTKEMEYLFDLCKKLYKSKGEGHRETIEIE